MSDAPAILSKETAIDRKLDVMGLKCPLPVLRAKKALGELAVGGTLEVLATDPLSVIDVEVFCRTSGHELVAAKTEGGVFRFVIRRMT
jgi:tRNA 2-thiouridine synthesizing protein A